MEKKVEISNITVDEIIKIFKEEERVELTIADAELIVEFLKMLATITIKRFLDE
ncbi:hypothetical protein SAMN05421846_10967 [Chryseobacterium taeanense]|uniref:Uncharacterized protein n=1 Tax=Chryseobacterium taeanense TaxID=311334 RepID=A0A1G8LE28_9FLAO|nr:hypothetical protein [Chryseobacterium taeanense]SDI53843.1 hypothetical protein SAMN05421846_10967 [Chryseobacterium taeanense]